MKIEYMIIGFCLLFASFANAEDCQNLKDSGDGIPAAYFQHECEGKKALRAKQYRKAVDEFKAALSSQKYEAPNYELNVELAEALCKLGKKAEAKKIIEEFRCMAAVDLGELECDDQEGNPNPKLSAKCYEELCPMLSGLTIEGRNKLLKRRAKIKEIEKQCK